MILILVLLTSSMVVIRFLFPSLAPMIVMIWFLFLLLLLAIFVHELGHAVLGRLMGYSIQMVSAGPLLIINTGKTFKLKENRHWLYFSGMTVMAPKKIDSKKSKLVVSILGGPVFSFASCMLSFVTWKLTSFDYWLYFSILNFVIFSITAIPQTQSEMNDGGYVWLILNDTLDKTDVMLNQMITAEMFTYKAPKNWDENLVQLAQKRIQKKETTDSLYLLFLFYYKFDLFSLPNAVSFMEPWLKASTIKLNNELKSYFYGVLILYWFIYKDKHTSLQEFEYAYQFVKPGDFLSYHRSRIIICYLKKNEKEMRKSIDNLTSYLKHFDNEGVAALENKMLQMVHEKIKKVYV